MTLPALSLLETRVLGVLVEKQHTVPDTYPLTLNALVAGCNQKTSRDPILTASEAEMQATIDHLRSLSLIVESSGGRVMRYAHNVERVLALPSQAVALLATLMLRGPQTVAELRANTERLHRFADISAVEGFLHELAERAAGALWSCCRASPAPARRAGRICCRAAGGRDELPRRRRMRRRNASPSAKLLRSRPTSRGCTTSSRCSRRQWRSSVRNSASPRSPG